MNSLNASSWRSDRPRAWVTLVAATKRLTWPTRSGIMISQAGSRLMNGGLGGRTLRARQRILARDAVLGGCAFAGVGEVGRGGRPGRVGRRGDRGGGGGGGGGGGVRGGSVVVAIAGGVGVGVAVVVVVVVVVVVTGPGGFGVGGCERSESSTASIRRSARNGL